MSSTPRRSDLLAVIASKLGIPRSYYEKAAARHLSLSVWLHRPESRVAGYDPDVHPQGSFRFGTVNRPFFAGEEYDLDNVCILRRLSKRDVSQEELKHLFGEEIRLYARAHQMAVPTEHKHCWRLPYADEVNFHLDTLPCVPEYGEVVVALTRAGVTTDLADRAVAITDKTHLDYRKRSDFWYSSNPRGFAEWFEIRAAMVRRLAMEERSVKAAVEPVPPYEWKTPLQQSVQLLKRHRDVMFQEHRDLAPISMILTNLAARAYRGERDLAEAVGVILRGMGEFVRDRPPYVPNPADPAEDYADKWRCDDRLQKNFWLWLQQAQSDFEHLATFPRCNAPKAEAERLLGVALTAEEEDQLCERRFVGYGPAVSVPMTSLSTGPRPWGGHG